MILRKLIFHSLSCLSLLAVHSPATAQVAPIAHPEIISVSVDTGTGRTGIKWKASTSPAIAKYTMFFDSTDILGQTSWFPTFDTVGRDARQWTFTEVNPGLSSRSFTVQSIDSSGNRSNFLDWHTTMHLKADYDSCSKQMLLEWNSYLGWENDLVRYDVYYSIDQGPFTLLADRGPTDTSYLQTDILDHQNYCYFIKAVKTLTVYSFSNKVCHYISHPIHPAWINAESASASGADSVIIKFAIDPAAEVRSYQLFKSSGPGKPFVEDAIIRDVGETLTRADPVVSTGKQYQYKLYSLDVCDNPVTGSNMAGNIVLAGSSKGLLVSLSWTPYEDYEAGVEYYQVYRDINHSGPVPLEIVSFPDTTMDDDLSDFSSAEIEDEICYYVEAVEFSDWIRGERGYSWSNRVCVSIVPEISMANALIPNASNAYNQSIKPELTFLPKEYIFQVYDRWGSRIFETTDSNIPWDGRVKGGQPANEGVYVYYIRLTTSSGIEVDKKGEITLFYK